VPTVYRRTPVPLVSSGTLGEPMAAPTALFPAPSLRRLRLAQMLSQEILATRAGVARSAIANLETGGKARAATIHKLAAALAVTIAQLQAQPADVMGTPPPTTSD
jgi:predicted transcriptional regulator